MAIITSVYGYMMLVTCLMNVRKKITTGGREYSKGNQILSSMKTLLLSSTYCVIHPLYYLLARGSINTAKEADSNPPLMS